MLFLNVVLVWVCLCVWFACLFGCLSVIVVLFVWYWRLLVYAVCACLCCLSVCLGWLFVCFVCVWCVCVCLVVCVFDLIVWLVC